MAGSPASPAAASSSSSSSSSPPSSSSPVPASNWLSGVNVVLVMAYGSLVRPIRSPQLSPSPFPQTGWDYTPHRPQQRGRAGFWSSWFGEGKETGPSPPHPCKVFVLLFIFVKRQIMRFAMKSRRGPHVPVGQHAPKGLKEEIDIRLSRVQDIRYEPRLLFYSDARLLQLESPRNPFPYDYVYRMKALDAVREAEIPYSMEGRYPKLLIEKNFQAYLLDLRNSSSPLKGLRKTLIDALLDGYENARYGTGAFGRVEFLKFQEALRELATILKAQGESSQRQHQSAAKDLTLLPDNSSPTIQVTYLPSSHKSKRAMHFLELKSFKDSYNTLESTL